MKKKIISILLAITFVLSFAIVPSMAEGPLSVELLADKTNFVTSTDEQIVTISVILKIQHRQKVRSLVLISILKPATAICRFRPMRQTLRKRTNSVMRHLLAISLLD